MIRSGEPLSEAFADAFNSKVKGIKPMASLKRVETKWAPRELLDQILEYCVIPTFDLVVELPHGRSVVMLRRTIAPYQNKWALPGLRMLKPEGINDVIMRIAEDELGVEVDPDSKRYIGQYVGRFKTERGRQDLSTGYAVRALDDKLTINQSHFSDHKIIGSISDIPVNTGAMYQFYLSAYFKELREVD